MDLRTEIEKRAAKIVHDEDRRFSREGKGRGFLDLRAGEKDEARRNRNTEKLADWLEKSLKGKSPELLNNIKDEDIRKAYVEKTDPLDAGKKLEFSAFKDIIVPPKGKRSWYDMDTEQLRYAMKDRGYKPEEMPEFLEKVSEHQQNYDIGKAIEEGLSGAGAINPFIAPSMTKEAISQSLAKDEPYSRAGMVGAGIQDVLATGGMMASPFAPWTRGANEIANLVKFGGTDAALELQRQIGDAARGNDYNGMAPLHAAVTAVTIPSLSAFVGQYLAKGGNATHPMATGFRQGSRGGQDPVKVEAENIKKTLIAAREQSKKAWNENNAFKQRMREMDSREQSYAENIQSQQSPTSLQDIANANAWENGRDLLYAFGYKSRTPSASTELADGPTPVATAPSNVYLQDIIGPQPGTNRGLGDIAEFPRVDESAIQNFISKDYSNPVLFSLDKSGGIVDDVAYETGKAYLDRLASVAPEKVAADLAKSAGAKQYKFGYGLGQSLSLLGSQLEPAGISLRDMLQNPDKFVENKRKARLDAAIERIKDEQLKKAIEEALKGGK